MSLYKVQGITLLVMGIFVLISSRISLYPRVSLYLGEYKDIVAFLFIFFGFFLWLYKGEEDETS